MFIEGSQISVAMATYNGSAYIIKQIDSIISQDLQPCEIIIVDDGSTDGTIEILKLMCLKYAFIKLYLNEINKGYVSAFKLAISICNAQYIALCDQDDIWESNKLSFTFRQLKMIEVKDLPCMVYTDLSLISADEIKLHPSFWKYYSLNPHRTSFYSLLFGNVVTGCTALFNKSMAKELILMPDSIQMHDHWMALIAYGFGRVKALSEQLVRYRSHTNSVTNKTRPNIVQSAISMLEKLNSDRYLHTYFQQSEIFNQTYNDKISNRIKYDMERFLKLKTSNNFIKLLQYKIRT